jgi:site-specific DNA recombinase
LNPSIQEGLERSGSELQVGADLLKTALMLCSEPARLYGRVSDESRRAINETFFERFYIEDHGLVSEAPLRPPFDEIAAAHARYVNEMADDMETPQRWTSGRELSLTEAVSRTLADRNDRVSVSSKTALVELRGFEPLTPSMRTRCATGLRHSPWTGVVRLPALRCAPTRPRPCAGCHPAAVDRR